MVDGRVHVVPGALHGHARSTAGKKSAFDRKRGRRSGLCAIEANPPGAISRVGNGNRLGWRPVAPWLACMLRTEPSNYGVRQDAVEPLEAVQLKTSLPLPPVLDECGMAPSAPQLAAEFLLEALERSGSRTVWPSALTPQAFVARLATGEPVLRFFVLGVRRDLKAPFAHESANSTVVAI